METVQIDGSENVRDIGGCDVELGQNFGFATGDDCVHVQLPRDGDEVLLKHLQGHNAGSGTPMFCDEFESAALFRGGSLVVGVDEDIRIEEAASGHYRRSWISSRLNRHPREWPWPESFLNSSMLRSGLSPPTTV